jgi:hypothetical protein
VELKIAIGDADRLVDAERIDQALRLQMLHAIEARLAGRAADDECAEKRGPE